MPQEGSPVPHLKKNVRFFDAKFSSAENQYVYSPYDNYAFIDQVEKVHARLVQLFGPALTQDGQLHLPPSDLGDEFVKMVDAMKLCIPGDPVSRFLDVVSLIPGEQEHHYRIAMYTATYTRQPQPKKLRLAQGKTAPGHWAFIIDPTLGQYENKRRGRLRFWPRRLVNIGAIREDDAHSTDQAKHILRRLESKPLQYIDTAGNFYHTRTHYIYPHRGDVSIKGADELYVDFVAFASALMQKVPWFSLEELQPLDDTRPNIHTKLETQLATLQRERRKRIYQCTGSSSSWTYTTRPTAKVSSPAGSSGGTVTIDKYNSSSS